MVTRSLRIQQGPGVLSGVIDPRRLAAHRHATLEIEDLDGALIPVEPFRRLPTSPASTGSDY